MANEQAKVAADKFNELYDFAPLDYFTFSTKGNIVELNLLNTVEPSDAG